MDEEQWMDIEENFALVYKCLREGIPIRAYCFDDHSKYFDAKLTGLTGEYLFGIMVADSPCGKKGEEARCPRDEIGLIEPLE